MNKLFFFTYGTEGQPFCGGWTAVEAPDRRAACAAFRAYHPDRVEGWLNCDGVYDEKSFMATELARSGNYGSRCHEIIMMQQRRADEVPVDSEELLALTKVLWQTNKDILKMRSQMKEIIRANNDLIWQLYGLAGQYDWPKAPDKNR